MRCGQHPPARDWGRVSGLVHDGLGGGTVIEELSDICLIIEVRLRISYAFRMDARRKFGYILGYSRKKFYECFFFHE